LLSKVAKVGELDWEVAIKEVEKIDGSACKEAIGFLGCSRINRPVI